ncbi:MAG: amino acid adenylation domain-containing protein [Nostoc sp. ChiSLP01]
MNLVKFLQNLLVAGIELWVEDGKLCYEAPEDALTPELLAEIKQYKPEIISLLQKQTYPLCHRQKALWFLYQLAPDSAAYNVGYAAQLVSNVNISALQQAAQALIERHAVLRTIYTVEYGEPVQTIQEHQQVCFTVQTAANWSQEDLQNWLLSESDRPFDLSNGPVIRFHLLIREITDASAAKQVILLMAAHHIVVDFWSLELLIDELRVIYQAINNGLEVTLPPQNLQYTDYMQWETQMLASQQGERLWNYWRDRLAGELPILNLPTDRPRPPVQTYAGASFAFVLEAELTHKLTELAKAEGVTVYTVVLAVFQVLLLRYTNQEDILIGSAMAGRSLEEFEKIVGYFTSPVVLRADLSGNPSFRELLRRVRDCVLGALEHQDYPFPLLVERLQPLRDPSRSSLYQVAIVWDRSHQNEGQVSITDSDGLIVKTLTPESKATPFDLILTFFDTTEALQGIWKYNTDLFDGSTIERMANHFVTLLKGIVANPHQPISQLPLLTKPEQQQLLVEWNNTQTDYPQDKCIHELFEAQVERTPNAVAVVYENEQLTYDELNCRANQLAHYLKSVGVKADVLVGLCIERSLEMVVGILGILKAGGAYVPLDPEYPSERLSLMLSDAQIEVLLTQQKLIERLPQHQAKPICLDSDAQIITRQNQENLISQVRPNNLAYIIYTSGSTGKPKGVMVAHSGLCNLALAQIQTFGVDNFSHILQFASLSFDASISEVVMSLASGATLYLATKDSLLPGMQLIELLRNYRITHITLPPSALAVLPVEELPALQTIIVAGEACSWELIKQWSAGRNFFNAYGPTEATVCATVAKCSDGDNKTTIGRPIANTQIYILDQYLQPVPVGVPGELHIGGAGLARGYLNRLELTQQKFIPNPFNNSKFKIQNSKLYKTGDLVRYLPSGNIEYLGRIDNQVKIRGFRIELGEIEAVLSQHPQVQSVVVIAREDHPAQKRLVAYIVPQQATPSISEIRQFLKTKLPDYMIPAAIVILESLPLTPNGKIDRRALPAPQLHRQDSDEFVAPRSPIEKMLAQIWSEVLRVGQVGIHDNFFELGGDSILTIQIIARANQQGINLSPKQLFMHQTISELAAVAGTTEAIQGEQGLVTGIVPLTPIQHWFFQHNQPQPHYFNQAVLLSVPSEWQPELLEQVVQYLLLHHDALRLRFVQSDSDWQQIHAVDADNSAFSWVDLSRLPATEQTSAIESTAAQLQASLNLSENLVRVAFFWLGVDTSRLVIVIHHLVVDGVSWRILLEDLQTAYQQLSDGKALQLPPKTTSFKDWSQKLTEYAQSQALKSELAYWLSESRCSIAPLPVDYVQGANTVASASTVTVSLNESETRALLQDVPKAYNTQINDVLVTALVQVLGRWTNSNSVLLNLEGHGRENIVENVDLSRTVGWFTTVFPVLVQLEATDNPQQALKSVKEQLRAIPHKGIGYGLLRYLSQDAEIAAKLQALVQAEVSFNYLGQFDQILNQSSVIQLATESAGAYQSLQNNRTDLLEINSLIIGNQLQINWSYSTNVHQRATIESLAQEFVERLRSLITHCIAPESGGYTPSDFPLVKLSQQELDRVLASIALKPQLGKINWKNLEDIYPLSPMQQGMLFHNLYAPESGVYFEQLSCTLRGNLDVSAFEQAWQQVIARYSTLRTAFVWEAINQPLQVVYRQVKVTLEFHDWRQLTTIEQQQQLEIFLQSDRQQGFQLSQAPLIRLNLIQLTADCYQFIWSHHHLLLDGWSLPLVFKDLLSAYQAFSQGESLRYQPTTNYKNYITWLQQQDLAKAETFWRQKLQGLIATTPLRVDKPLLNQQQPHSSYSEQQIQLTAQATASIQAFSRQHQLTINNLLQATWALLLCRYSGETDVVFGVTVSGRPPSVLGIESMVGMSINTLPVRVQVLEDTQLLPWLKDLQSQQVESEQYSYTPLVEIQSWSEIPRGMPLFESIVVFENYPVNDVVLQHNGTLEISNIRGIEQTNYPLTVVAVPGEQLSVKMSYDTSRFDDPTITRMLGHFQTLLAGIVDNPQQAISQLPLLTKPEQQQLLVEWNNTQTDYPQDQCIHELFEAQVERTPDAVAVVYENEQLTYDELNCRANQLAHYLKSVGVKADMLVGLCVERSLEMVVGILGILKAGGAYVPLDPDYPTERLSFMLADAQIELLLTQQKLIERLPQHQAKPICLDTDAEVIREWSQDNPITDVQASNLAYVIYTSGSTGQPKGVEVLHRGVNRLLFGIDYAHLDETQKILQMAPISFDASTLEIWGALLHGGECVLFPGKIPTSQQLSDEIHKHGITTLWLTAALFNSIINDAPQALSEIKQLFIGGEALSVAHVRKALETLPLTQIINGYGPTESTTFTCCYSIPKSLQTTIQSIPIGRPIGNTQIYILDQYLQPVPVGVPGELYIGGAGLARGYLNRPELTQQKFIPNPFNNSKLYKTGDLVRYLLNGNIEYLGRIDNQVKIRGFRIELGEIEAVLSQHPQVQSVVVTAREDRPGEKCLVAYIVPQQATPSISELRQFLKTKLPEYMIPAAIVILESLPLTPNGKIDRRALPAPELHRQDSDKFVVPRSPIEEMLAQIWVEVLKLEQVGIYDNFFENGGHSLLATQLISRIRSTLKVEIPLRSLFAAPTVAELGQYIQHKQQQQLKLTAPPLLPTIRNAELPLSFAQQRLWFLHQLQPNSGFYNIPVVVRLQGRLQVTALEQSLQEIIHRHEALRTNFITIDGQPVQIIHPETSRTLSIVDWQHLPANEQEIATEEFAAAQAQQPFDLATSPLIKTTLVVLNETEHILLVCMHHIVSDGWSMGVFVQELATLYNAFCQGQPSPLAPLPIQYADFAQWQRQWLQGDVLQTQLTYWQQQLANAPVLLSLPTDRPRPAAQTYKGAHKHFALSFELTNGLAQLSQQQGVTLYMMLLAAFDTLLYRYTGTEDILVGTPIANRDRSEIEGLIGFFVNTLVMRADVSGNPKFSELLDRIREMAMDTYAHQNLPFEMLVEALQPERNLSHTPLFQVMFVLQNAPMSQVELSGLTVSSLITESATAKFDLTLQMENTAAGLVGWWEYNTDLFDGSTIERMANHFVTLLEGIVANPHQPISELPLLTAVEQQQLLVEWNNTQTDYPQDKCIHELFEAQVERTPNAVAVVYENEQLTYDELNCRANQLAHYLKSVGVKADVLVGLCIERSLEMVVGILGILKAGGAYVPLDPDYPSERLSFMLADAQVGVLLTQQKLIERLPQHQAKPICLDTNWQTIQQQRQDNLNSSVTADNLAYVIYTSGSTGTPKGVAVAHSAVNRLVLNTNYVQLQPDDRVAQAANIAFDAATFEIWGALLNGARLVGISQEVLLSPQKFAAHIQQTEISVLFLTTALFNQIASFKLQVFNSLRYLLFGGEAADPRCVEQVLYNDCPQKLLNVYGPTENTTFSSCYLVQDVPANAITIPIGRPIANTQLYILDQYLQPVPVGVPGELYIGGAGLARGYLNRPELTQQKFIPNPFNNSKFKTCTERSRSIQNSKLYKTGDLVRYLSNGNIEYLGRIDQQVKIRGFRIELGEIEAVLSQHPQVQSVVVTAREDRPGEKCLVAYIVPQQATPSISELRQFLKTKLPDYMIPAAMVILDSLPLTPNGKIDRRALPAPDTDNFAMQASFIPALDIVEQKLAQIWAEVLKVYPIGVKDNFFDLGGNSLLAVQLMARIEQQFNKNLPLATLFQNSTIQQLANVLRQPIDAFDWSPLVPIQPHGSKQPFFCLPGAGGNTIYLYNLAHYLGKDQPFYGLQSLGLDGESKPHTRIEDMAAYYIEAIQAIQPNGPYLLGGHSFGGMVAFEMANQLQKQGYKVGLLAILDSGAPGCIPDDLVVDGVDDAGWLTKIASLFEGFYGKSVNVSYETLKLLTPNEQLNNLKEQLQKANLLPADVGLKQLRGLIEVFKTNHQTACVYLPQKIYSGQIKFFKASEIDAVSNIKSEIFQEIELGWNKFSAQPLDVHYVPGNHLSILNEPHVRFLAEQLKICIEQAQGE